MRVVVVLFVSLASLSLSSCSSTQGGEKAAVKPAVASPAPGARVAKKPAARTASTGDASQADVPPRVQQVLDNFRRVHFRYDSSELDEETRAALAENAAIFQRHQDLRVEIQGHADERGTHEYNLALGDRRATAVRQYLGRLGVDVHRVTAVSYGEETPLATGRTEQVYSKNRRVEFRVTWSPDAGVQGSTR